VKFQVLTAASMLVTVFWDVTPCSLVSEVLTASIIRTVISTYEMSVSFYETKRRNIPEYGHLQVSTSSE
jgi:hypothetical protein